MKFLTFVDLHEHHKSLKLLLERAEEKDIDFIVCAGDLSNFGNGLLKALSSFDKLGKPFLFIPGNHEEKINFAPILNGFPHCIDLHLKAQKIGNYTFLGYGGDGFMNEDANFRKIAREWYGKYKQDKTILLTHGPPYGTKLDHLTNGHTGNKDYRKFVDRFQPKLMICGHFHENAGAMDVIGKTKAINPGWEGMVIELK